MSGVLAGLIDSLKLFGKSGFQLGKGFIVDESGNVISQSDISGAKVGFPSNTVNQVQNIPRAGSTFNPNTFILGTAATAGAVGGALVFTNPGFQQTAQSYSQGFNSLAQGASSITTTLSQNPLILIALIGLGVIVILKK